MRNDQSVLQIKDAWSVTGLHVNGEIITKKMEKLEDLKGLPEWVNFCGTIIYQNNIIVEDQKKVKWMDLGKAVGISELFINGKDAGAKWYGRRIYPIGAFIRNGKNTIEIKMVTTMGNYLKSLADNPIAQFWTNKGRTNQPLQSTGLQGPVRLY
jgi:hypothetical protein